MISLKPHETFIIVFGSSQLLTLYQQGRKHTFNISTSKKGFSEAHNSYKTPRGWHYIRAVIGENNPISTNYSRRRVSNQKTKITSRILWLCGIEEHNHQSSTHSMLRYIYIHGTPKKITKRPESDGCINMNNKDIQRLTDLIPPYCKVYIDSGE